MLLGGIGGLQVTINARLTSTECCSNTRRSYAPLPPPPFALHRNGKKS
jgi:hypothetical protein